MLTVLMHWLLSNAGIYVCAFAHLIAYSHNAIVFKLLWNDFFAYLYSHCMAVVHTESTHDTNTVTKQTYARNT